MINYNSGIIYNAGVKGGGAMYNSAIYNLIEVSDDGHAQEILSLLANIATADTSTGIDIISIVKMDTETYLIVTQDSILEPLNLHVMRDSKVELLPQTRDMTEEIPGRHGEFDFGTEYKARNITLHVATPDGMSQKEKEDLKRKIANCLNPVKGIKKLVFLDDMDKQYTVKLSGKIDPTNYVDWFQFEIPLKMSDPFIESLEEHSLIGSGTITNAGNFETGLIIEIAGPVINPSVTVGTDTLKYTGTIADGETLIIDTDKQTVKIGNTNVAGDYNGVFPSIPPGDTSITASSNVTVKWRDKWI